MITFTGGINMKSFALVSQKKFEEFENKIPLPAEHEIQVKVKACGVCSSEVSVWENENPEEGKPLFLGHEVSGVVTKVGDLVKDFKVGDRVSTLAEKGFSEYVTVHSDYAILISDGIPYELALGEPLACAMNAVKRSNIEVGDTVAIIGLGFMGQLMLQGIKLKGATKIIAIDIRNEALKLSRELGSSVELNPKNEDVIQSVLDMTNHEGVDVVIEATGSQAALDMATELVKIRGSLIIYGYHQGSLRTVDMQQWNWKGLDVINAHERNPDVYMEGMKIGIKLLESGHITMSPLITHTFPLDQVNRAFEYSLNKPKGFFKSVVKLF